MELSCASTTFSTVHSTVRVLAVASIALLMPAEAGIPQRAQLPPAVQLQMHRLQKCARHEAMKSRKGTFMYCDALVTLSPYAARALRGCLVASRVFWLEALPSYTTAHGTGYAVNLNCKPQPYLISVLFKYYGNGVWRPEIAELMD